MSCNPKVPARSGNRTLGAGYVVEIMLCGLARPEKIRAQLAPYHQMKLGAWNGDGVVISINIASCSGWMGSEALQEPEACWKETWGGAAGTATQIPLSQPVPGASEIRQTLAFHDSPGVHSADSGNFWKQMKWGQSTQDAWQIAYEVETQSMNSVTVYTVSESSDADAINKGFTMNLTSDNIELQRLDFPAAAWVYVDYDPALAWQQHIYEECQPQPGLHNHWYFPGCNY